MTIIITKDKINILNVGKLSQCEN